MKKSLPSQPPVPKKKRVPLVSALVLVILVPLVMGALAAWHSMGGLDIWLHQQVGQEILQEGKVPTENQFSFAEPNHPWTNHEWLFQILIAGISPGEKDWVGAIKHWNIVRLALTLLLLTALLLGDRPWLKSPLHLSWVSPGILLGVLLLWPRLLLRPELVSYFLLVLLVNLREKSLTLQENHRPGFPLGKWDVLAFLLTVLWLQFHGFAALAPMVWLLGGILCYLPGSPLPRPQWKSLLLGSVLLFGAQLLSPNGWQGLIYPFKALAQFSGPGSELNGTISEMVPLLQTPDSLNLTILAFKLSLVLGILTIWVNLGKISYLRIFLWGLATAATLLSQRNLGFYGVTFVLLHTGILENNSRPTPLDRISPKVPRLAVLLPVLGTLILSGWMGNSLVNDRFYLGEGVTRRFGTGPTVARYPFQSAEILARTPGSRVFANVDAAAISLGPGKSQVFLDGRTEAYSPKTWATYKQIRQGDERAVVLLEQIGAQKALLSLSGGAFLPLVKSLLDSPQWQVVSAEPAGILFAQQSQDPRSNNQAVLSSLVQSNRNTLPTGLNSTREADFLAAKALLAELAGQSAAQEAFLRQGLASCPKHPLLNHNLGTIFLQKAQPKTALEYFTKALRTNPRLASTALNAGVCFMHLKAFGEAEEQFARSLKLRPENYQAWANHSLALQQMGRFVQARSSLEEAMRLSPNNPRLRQAWQFLNSKK